MISLQLCEQECIETFHFITLHLLVLHQNPGSPSVES